MRYHPQRQPNNLGILGEPDGLDKWFSRLRWGPLAVDTETTGLRWDKDRVGGLCLAAGDTACYFYGNALARAAEWLSAQVKRERHLVFHHNKYDQHMMRGTFGLRINYPVDDTYLMSFLLDNRGARQVTASFHGGHGLKNLAAAFVDPEAKNPEDQLRDAIIAAGGRRGKKAKEEWKNDLLLGPPEMVGRYGCLDGWYTLQLYHQFYERLKHWQQPGEQYPSLWSLYENERWLSMALRDMEERGIRVNQTFFAEWKDELEKQKIDLENQLNKMAKVDINWGSDAQVREVLFNKMGFEPTRWTKSGAESVDEVALLDLKHDIGTLLLRHRDVKKQLTTYARGLLAAAESWSDGRIHCNFKQAGARTGRMSCEDPNLQQVPRKSGARRGFLPDEGLEFRFADYSQVEMRFAAHFSEDPVLCEGFLHDPDFDTHAATAKKMYGLVNEPEEEQRKFAKIMNFAMLFGAGENKVTSQLVSMLTMKEAKRAVRQLGYKMSAGEQPHRTLAQLLRKIYFREFPSIKGARYDEQEATSERGYAMNAFGRHRYLEHDEVYKAFNTAIQGSAADQAKHGLVAVYRELQIGTGELALLLQIHDEIVYLTDGNPKTDRKVLQLLNDEERFNVPIVADCSGSKTNWQEKVKIDIKPLRRRRAA